MWRAYALIFAHDELECFKLFKAAGQNLGGDVAGQLPLQFGKSQAFGAAEQPNNVHEPFLRKKRQRRIERAAGRPRKCCADALSEIAIS